MSKEKARMKINPLGSMMLIIILVAIAGGWQLGKEYMRDKICGDISFYLGSDKDLARIRACEGK